MRKFIVEFALAVVATGEDGAEVPGVGVCEGESVRTSMIFRPERQGMRSGVYLFYLV